MKETKINEGKIIDQAQGRILITDLCDQDIDGVIELYRVELATPGVSSKLNPALAAGQDVEGDFAITPDGTIVMYRADQDTDNRTELYGVLLATPGVSSKLNPALGIGMDVEAGFAITPDGKAVVYRADQDIDGVIELYGVFLVVVGNSIKFNPPFIVGAGREVVDFAITPDGTAVVYRADQDIDNRTELYRVELATPGVSSKLNPALAINRDVENGFAITPDGTAVVYLADQDTNNIFELYRVELATLGVSSKLNPALAGTMDVENGFAITPDGTAVVYRADQDMNNVVEFYRVALATPGVSSKLNGVLVVGGGVDTFTVIN
ncbi:hypothetical protein JYT12_00095 [Beggiatoa alba]|nr:hypothetical protein [Beggiatoa alba]